MRTCSRICMYQQSRVSLRTATPLLPTDAIGRFQIGFTTVEAGDFPNGLRCNRQILYIRICHSAHYQISSFPAHWKTGLIKLLFPGIHVLHMNERAVFITIQQTFDPSARLTSNPLPSSSRVNTCGHSGRLVVCFVCDLLPRCRLTWHIINNHKNESAICTLCLKIGSQVGSPLLAF